MRFDIPVLLKKKVVGKFVVALFLEYGSNPACVVKFSDSYDKIRSEFISDSMAMGYLFWPIKDMNSFISGMQTRFLNIFNNRMQGCSVNLYIKRFLINNN
jgi:hypothetical protein